MIACVINSPLTDAKFCVVYLEYIPFFCASTKDGEERPVAEKRNGNVLLFFFFFFFY